MSKARAKRLIGRVVMGEAMVTAALFDDATWDVSKDGEPIPAMAEALAARYADTYRGPQDGQFGRRILADLAERSNGTLVLEDEDRTSGNVVS
jgi:hypothetical protein